MAQHWIGGWLWLILKDGEMGWSAFGKYCNATNSNLALPLKRKMCNQGKGRPNEALEILTPHKIFQERWKAE